jgi:uncharacterized protein
MQWTLTQSVRPNVFQFVAMGLLTTFAYGQEAEPTVSVTGDAEMRILADEIVILASIESRAKTAADACADNRQKSRLLVDFLKSQNIDEQMIDVDLLSISEILPDPPSSKGKGYQQDDNPFGAEPAEENPFGVRRRAIGYTAFRRFAISVKDLKKFEDIYQGIVEKGINRVDSVRYRSSKEKEQLDKLHVSAVQVAKQRARAMANELGAKVQAIKSIGNSHALPGGSDSRMGMGRSMGGYSDPFGSDDSSTTAAQIILRSSVDVVFYLSNAKFKE